MDTTPEQLKSMFEFALGVVHNSGGDGWAFIVSKYWKEMAEVFNEYSKEKMWYWQIGFSENDIMFYDAQEGITFLPDRKGTPDYPRDDLVIEIEYYGPSSS